MLIGSLVQGKLYCFRGDDSYIGLYEQHLGGIRLAKAICMVPAGEPWMFIECINGSILKVIHKETVGYMMIWSWTKGSIKKFTVK